MERVGPLNFLEGLPFEERKKHLLGGQSQWYLLCSQLFRNRRVIDCGAGDGSGASLLRGQGNCQVTAIDPNPSSIHVEAKRLADVDPADAVVLIDVLEHTFHPKDLLNTAAAKADATFFSTPNWNCSRCENQFHVFELTPPELEEMLQPWKNHGYLIKLYGGTTRKCIVELPGLNDSHFPAQFGVLLSKTTRIGPVEIRPGTQATLRRLAEFLCCKFCDHCLTPCILGTGLVCNHCGESFIPQAQDLDCDESLRRWMPQILTGPVEPPSVQAYRDEMRRKGT